MKVQTDLPNGCLFCYDHSSGEPYETRDMAKRTACAIAEGAAIDTGQNYIVARSIKPRGYSVFPAGHRGLNRDKLVPVYEITPESACIRLEQ